MDLFDLHPIFEFFLVLYTTYLVSDDIKRIIDKQVIKLLIDLKFTERIFENKEKLINKIRETKKVYKAIISAAEIASTSSEAKEVIEHYKNERFSRLDKLEKDISEQYELNDHENLFKSETSFTNVFKIYTLYFSIYCFIFLFINGFPELLKEQGFYTGLLSFDICTISFLIFIFGISFVIGGKFTNTFTLILWIIFIAISFVYYNKYPQPTDVAKNYSIGAAALLLLAPILLYLLRVKFSGGLLTRRIQEEYTSYENKITLIKDELQNPDRAINAYKTLSQVREEVNSGNAIFTDAQK